MAKPAFAVVGRNFHRGVRPCIDLGQTKPLRVASSDHGRRGHRAVVLTAVAAAASKAVPAGEMYGKRQLAGRGIGPIRHRTARDGQTRGAC